MTEGIKDELDSCEGDPCPPVIIVFTTTDMVETVLNAARGEGLGKNFKEHIPEAYAKVYSDYIKVRIFLKETQQLNYRLRFDEHTLQLQVKHPSSDQFKIIKVWTPKAAINTLIEVEALKGGDTIEPTEEDTRKITLTLGDIKVDQSKEPQEVPG